MPLYFIGMKPAGDSRRLLSPLSPLTWATLSSDHGASGKKKKKSHKKIRSFKIKTWFVGFSRETHSFHGEFVRQTQHGQ